MLYMYKIYPGPSRYRAAIVHIVMAATAATIQFLHHCQAGAKERKRVYEQAVHVVERRGNFTPIVLSVDGLLHREAEHFLKRIAANLAHRLVLY